MLAHRRKRSGSAHAKGRNAEKNTVSVSPMESPAANNVTVLLALINKLSRIRLVRLCIKVVIVGNRNAQKM